MSITEALFHAEQSSDLSDVADQVADVDFLRAAGCVAKAHATALAVWRLIEQGDHTQARTAIAGLLAACVRLDIHHNAHETVSNVLSWMHKPTCPSCAGRGYELIPGTPHLSERACGDCGGTGQRDPHWSDDEHRLHCWIKDQQGDAARAIARKLKG